VKTLKNIAAVACVAALAVPAAVLAKGPSGDHGKSGEQHGNKNKTAKPHHVSNRCKKQPKVGFVLGGKLDPASTPTNIIVDVKHSNKHSRPFVTNGQYTVPSGSNVQYKGDNPFTTPGAEMHRGDWKVQVIGKVIKNKKGCTATNSPAPTIKKVMVIAPGSGESGSNESGSNESGSNESGGNVSGSNQS
jgi:hypothetical protein